MIRRKMALFALMALLFSSANGAFANEQKATAQLLISKITTSASKILSAQEKSLEEREEKLHLLLKKNIDFNFIGSLVLGTYWTSLSAEKKEEFVDLFSDFFLRSYAPQFGGYPGERLVINSIRKNGASDVFVRLELHRPKRNISISEWRIREFGGVPKIIDVKISGISVVISHRVGFHQHIDKRGFDGLITLLRIRADRLAAQQ